LAADLNVRDGSALPVRAEDEEVSGPMPRKNRTITILLVDDQKRDRDAMRHTLETAGYQVLEAADYSEAIRVHGQRRTEIRLLLTAIALPGNNGYELAKTVFQNDPNLKVLFVSGPTGAEVSRFYNMPVVGPHLLEKPVQSEDLLYRVNQATRSRKRRSYAQGAQ
jgi:two-component system cell cycle sensor histidine kinase/response regulator CckA